MPLVSCGRKVRGGGEMRDEGASSWVWVVDTTVFDWAAFGIKVVGGGIAE